MVNRGEKVILFDQGNAKRDYTYVDDIVAGFEAALTHQKNGYHIFNLGRGETVDLRHLITLIEEALGKKAQIETAEQQPGEVHITLADISKAQTLLGYQPMVSIEEGIPRFIRWYLEKREVRG